MTLRARLIVLPKGYGALSLRQSNRLSVPVSNLESRDTALSKPLQVIKETTVLVDDVMRVYHPRLTTRAMGFANGVWGVQGKHDVCVAMGTPQPERLKLLDGD